MGSGDAAPGTLLHSGEVTSEVTDLAVKGRGIDFAFTRTYRSHHLDSERWDHVTLRPGDVVVSTSMKAGTTWMQRIMSLLVFGAGPLPAPLVERVVAPVEAALPVRKGQRLGEVQVLDRGKVIASSPLVAANAVERPGRLGRVGFYAGRTLDHLGGLLP